MSAVSAIVAGARRPLCGMRDIYRYQLQDLTWKYIISSQRTSLAYTLAESPLMKSPSCLMSLATIPYADAEM
jgi:hypothetical protein